MAERGAIPLEGELNCWVRDFDLPDLLLVVCATGRTGLLRFVNAEAEKTLFLRGGRIIFATSTSLDDRLGEYLLREGTLQLRDLSRLSHLVRPGKRLGGLLVEHGLLSPEGLVRAVKGQVRAIVLSLFGWTECWYGFTEQELPSKETITLNLATEQIILDGVRRVDSWRRITKGLGDVAARFRAVDVDETALRRLELDTASLEILAMLRRARSVEEVCAAFPLSDLDVCRRLWAFRCLGWIVPAGDEAEGDEVASPVPAPAEVEPLAVEPVPVPEGDAPAAESEEPVAEAATPLELSEDDPLSSSPSVSLADLATVDAEPARASTEAPSRPAAAEGSARTDRSAAEPAALDEDLEGLGFVLGDSRPE